MKINRVEFERVADILPKRDQQQRLLEERPASRYSNRRKLPLNKYGNGPFRRFRIEADGDVLDSIGIYAIVRGTQEVLYIGKCTRPTSALGKRFNSGYGSIQPRNCFRGGQSTNRRINHDILEASKKGNYLSVVFHRCLTGADASAIEAQLIRNLGPPWNINIPR